jgi:hypothetical protein
LYRPCGTWFHFLAACGTTEVVPFPGVLLPESSEGWGCGIPPFANDARPFDLAQGGLWGHPRFRAG